MSQSEFNYLDIQRTLTPCFFLPSPKQNEIQATPIHEFLTGNSLE
jgi:hypothetical protein